MEETVKVRSCVRLQTVLSLCQFKKSWHGSITDVRSPTALHLPELATLQNKRHSAEENFLMCTQKCSHLHFPTTLPSCRTGKHMAQEHFLVCATFIQLCYLEKLGNTWHRNISVVRLPTTLPLCRIGEQLAQEHFWCVPPSYNCHLA